MKAKGFNPKEFDATKTREVPTAKADLMEFLNFFVSTSIGSRPCSHRPTS
jgi:hypothetical protein